jgi:pimeloyl-ACP methyl ester carboxylesterase
MCIALKHENIWFDVIGEKEYLDDGRRVQKPTVIFIHGGGGTHSSSRQWANKLSDIAQCIEFDLPGHGRSSISTNDRWNLADWADVLVEFCHALDIQQPILHGGSMGGCVAQSVAVRHPGFAAKLILLVTAARRDNALVQARFTELGGDAAGAAYARTLTEPDSPDAFAAFMQHCLPLYSVRHGAGIGQVLAKHGTFGVTERNTLAWFSRPGGDFDTFDFRTALGSVTTPTLILAGALDPVIPLAAVREMYESFAPGVAQLEVFEQASHAMTEDMPEDYLRLVRAFVSEIA